MVKEKGFAVDYNYNTLLNSSQVMTGLLN